MTAILTRDLLLNFLMGLTALVILVLAAIAPAAQEDPLDPPGNLVASISWPAGSTDVDLRVGAPNDAAVDYKRKSGRTWSLLRDDLGTANDDTDLNFESAFTRGLPDGEYAVNVRCFGCAGKVPVAVGVEVRLASGELIWRGVVDLVADKQERSAVRFGMADGKVLAGSASAVFKKLEGE